MTWLAFRYGVRTALLLMAGVLFCGFFSLVKPTYALIPLGGLVFYALYVLKPAWAIVLSLAASPLLDQASLRPFHGLGFDLAGVVRGSALVFMWVAILTQNKRALPARKGLFFVSVLVLASFVLSLIFSINVIASVKAFFGFSYWVTFYLYLTLTLDEYPMGNFVPWGLIAAGYVILATMAPYEIGHVYEPYTNGALSIYGRYNSGPFNLAVSVAFLIPMVVILRTRWQRLAYLPLVPALFYILGNTYVRTGAVIVALFVLYFLIQRSWTRWAISGAVPLVLVIGLSSKSLRHGWLARLQQGHTLNTFASGRLGLYSTSLKDFVGFGWTQKVIGVGLGNARVVLFHSLGWQVVPQNDFLSALLGAGLIGLVGILVYLFGVWREIISEGRQTPAMRQFGVFVFLAIVLTASINGIFTGESTAMVFAMSLIAVSHSKVFSKAVSEDFV